MPAPFKVGSAFAISLLVSGLVQPEQVIEMDAGYLFLLLKEIFVGLSLGFCAAVLLYAVQLAGTFVDMQSGFAMATMFNPQTGIQEHLTGRFFYILAILFFLSIDGHHLLIRGVLASYEWIPAAAQLPAEAPEQLAAFMVLSVKNLFWIAILMASPVVGTLFLTDLSLGILSRTVPQMNLFVIGIPVKIAVHFIVLFLVMPVFFMVMGRLVQTMVHSLEQMLAILGA